MAAQGVAQKPVEKTGVHAFDLRLTRRIWKSAFVRKFSPNYWEFTIHIPENSTKLIVAVSSRMTMCLHIDLVTADCPPLNEGRHKPHQRLAAVSFRGIEKIIYHLAEGYIDFQFSREAGENDRKVRVFSWGYFWAN